MSSADSYVEELLATLMSRAMEAKATYVAARTQRDEEGTRFEAGRAVAYYEVVATLVNQLEVFGLSLADVGLDPDTDVDSLLL